MKVANKILLERRKCNCVFFESKELKIKILELKCKECLRKSK